MGISLLLFCFLVMLLADLVIIFILYRKNYSKDLSACCIYFLFIPFFSFQQIGPGTLAAFFLATIPAAIYGAIKVNCKIRLSGNGIWYLLLLSVFIAIFGVFDFEADKYSGAKGQMYFIAKDFSDWSLKQREIDQTFLIFQDSLLAYIKANITTQKDSWNNQYKFVYKLD